MAMPIAAEVGDKITRQYTEDHRPKWADSGRWGRWREERGTVCSLS